MNSNLPPNGPPNDGPPPIPPFGQKPVPTMPRVVKLRRGRPTGGTTLEEERSTGLVLGGLLLAAGIGIILFFATRNGDPKAEPSAQPATEVNSGAQGTEVELAPGADEGLAFAEEPVAPVGRVAAMEELGAELNRLELWSELEIDTDNVTLRATSAYCGDAKFRSTLSKNTAALKGQGFVGIRCFERYGQLIFEQNL